jgi:hypothetical protein
MSVIEVHAGEPLVPGPSRLEVEIAIAKLINRKSPGREQILAELIHKLMISDWNKEKFPEQWCPLLY